MKFAELPFEAQRVLLIHTRAFSLACAAIYNNVANDGKQRTWEHLTTGFLLLAIQQIDAMSPEQFNSAIAVMDRLQGQGKLLNPDVLSCFGLK